jgi:hypothetical protein
MAGEMVLGFAVAQSGFLDSEATISETTIVRMMLPPIETGTAKNRRRSTSARAKIARWRYDGTGGA